MDKKDLLRQIPKIDEVLKDQRLFDFFGNTQRELIVEAVRESIDNLRAKVLAISESEKLEQEKTQPEGESASALNAQKAKKAQTIDISIDAIIEDIINKIRAKKQKSLRRVINGTGTILHTNLGRARLSDDAGSNVLETITGYSTLEYDLKKGGRGSRHDHIEKLIEKIAGAEGALVVNNNAAAVLLCLSALAKNKEVIVSRGELVEIGGSFRIPEIMELGGAHLKEIGTTNKTNLRDYEKAIDAAEAQEPGSAGMLLKVHTSNYKIMGFTQEVDLKDLVELGRTKNIPVVYDLGSGLMVDLKDYGIDEPTVFDAVKTGADVVTFSGDKLFGGPQSGIIIGKKEYIEKMKGHPLARAIRVDKMTLAALESVFRKYIEPEEALERIPVLAMISRPLDSLRKEAVSLAKKVRAGTEAYYVEVEKIQGQIGGGSTPNQFLESYGISVVGKNISPDKIEREMRALPTPVIVRINQDKVIIDMRTLLSDEASVVAQGLIEIGERNTAGKKNSEKNG